jgi:predicted O-methyltransferase YrrM
MENSGMIAALAEAEKVFGWMNREELEWLFCQAALASRVCEVGVHLGRSTLALAAAGCRVWAVDLWENPQVYEQFHRNLEGRKNLIAMKGPSVAVARTLRVLFDFVFIDADHSYPSVKADILAWVPKVCRGGILAGHDYDPAWPGVVQAVDEIFPLNRKRGPGSIWYVVR